jgi:hypothetical protein
MADGNTPPPDISEAFQTGTVRTAAFQTTGVYKTGDAVSANAGQGDAYTVLTSPTRLDEAGMNALMDRMQAATAGTQRVSTGVIAQIAQLSPAEPGCASFEVTMGSRGDSPLLLAKIGPDNAVKLIDPSHNIPPERYSAEDFGQVIPDPDNPDAPQNNVTRARVDLKPGEKLVALAASDGMHEAHMGSGDPFAHLRADMEAYAKANPESQNWSRFLAEEAAARHITRATPTPGDNITVVSTELDTKSDLKGNNLTMAVFDEVNHDQNSLSTHLARTLETELPGAVKSAPVISTTVPHIATRPEDIARLANPGAADPHAAGPKPAERASARVDEAPAGSKFAGTVGAHAGHATGAAGIALDLAEGNYTQAGISAGQQALLNPTTLKTAATVVEEVAPEAARGLGFVAKRLPLVGALVTAGYVAYEVGGDLYHGEYGKAGAATVAGGAEIGGNIVGFGVGDAARETVRETVVLTAGENYAPDKSGLRSMGEKAYSLGSKLINGSGEGDISAQQAALVGNDPILPKTVKISGHDVALAEALRDPGFAKEFRSALEHANGRDGIDLSHQIGAVDAFAKLESQRKAAPAGEELASTKPSALKPTAPTTNG